MYRWQHRQLAPLAKVAVSMPSRRRPEAADQCPCRTPRRWCSRGSSWCRAGVAAPLGSRPQPPHGPPRWLRESRTAAGVLAGVGVDVPYGVDAGGAAFEGGGTRRPGFAFQIDPPRLQGQLGLMPGAPARDQLHLTGDACLGRVRSKTRRRRPVRAHRWACPPPTSILPVANNAVHRSRPVPARPELVPAVEQRQFRRRWPSGRQSRPRLRRALRPRRTTTAPSMHGAAQHSHLCPSSAGRLSVRDERPERRW